MGIFRLISSYRGRSEASAGFCFSYPMHGEPVVSSIYIFFVSLDCLNSAGKLPWAQVSVDLFFIDTLVRLILNEGILGLPVVVARRWLMPGPNLL